MTRFILFILVAYLTTVLSLPLDADEKCFLNLNSDFTYQHPLILNPNKNEFIVPNTKKGINFSKGETIRLSCPGPKNHIKVSTSQEAIVACIANNTFALNGSNHLFKELRCENYPESIAKRTGKKCSQKYTEIAIGFNTSTGYIPIMINCLDETTKNSLYSKYLLSKMVKTQQYSVPRPNDFKEGDFYSDLYPKISVLYTKNSQRTAFERILNSTDLAIKYISLDSDFFLSRGHLTPKGDYIYAPQQRATFYYVNVAPQWHTFNGNNWNEVEKSCRNYASKQKLDLDVYTGIFGQSKLPDINNNYQNLSMYVDKNNKQKIAIPEIYWRVLHDPATSRGVVLVGHNNPYNQNVSTICKDVSGKLNWLTWDAKNVTAGISYGCEFSEFKKLVSYMPDIKINSLLT